MVNFGDVMNNPVVQTYIQKADENLGVLGYTEHGFRHCKLVADTARRVMLDLGQGEREAELASIAGYLHDIGNVIERTHHYYIGALLAMRVLREMGMGEKEVVEIASAIGSHDDANGQPVSRISAAVILADKSDVHRSRVRNPIFTKFDIHDRVNYAVEESSLDLDAGEGTITLKLTIDSEISRVMEYFEIFLSRMVLCRRAADFLSARFCLLINEAQLL